MKLRWLSVSMLLVSCSGEAGGPARAVGEARQDLTVLDYTVRARLKDRLDFTRFALGPREPVKEVPPFEALLALSALEEVTGEAFAPRDGEQGFRAESAHYVCTFAPESGQLSLESTHEYRRGLEHAHDTRITERAHALLSGIVADLHTSKLDLMHLGATTRSLEDRGAESDARIGSKVFVIRELGGIRVAGNRLVASFATDGTLVGARGLWPHLDLSASQLSSELTLAQVTERALDVLAAHGVNPERDEPIELESFYQVERTERGHAVRLRGAALVVSYGHDDTPGRKERHEFEL